MRLCPPYSRLQPSISPFGLKLRGWSAFSTSCAAATGSRRRASSCGRWPCWSRRPAALSIWFATSDGLNDYQDRPLGTDFSNVYAAGTYVLEAVRPRRSIRACSTRARKRFLATRRRSTAGTIRRCFSCRRRAGVDAVSTGAGGVARRDARALSAGDRAIILSLHPLPRRGRVVGEADRWGRDRQDLKIPPPGALRAPPSPSGGGMTLLLAVLIRPCS